MYKSFSWTSCMMEYNYVELNFDVRKSTNCFSKIIVALSTIVFWRSIVTTWCPAKIKTLIGCIFQ